MEQTRPAHAARKKKFSGYRRLCCVWAGIFAACLLLGACMSLFPSKSEKTSPETPLAAPQPARLSALPADQDAGLCFSLALPMQSPMRSVSEKIVFGASTARKELERLGTDVHVRLLDSDQPDWLNQLAALPPQCALVGGPLQSAAYTAVKSAQSVYGRAFFVFLPQIGSGDEGFTAWRFFPSPQDQAEALLGFARTELGFTAYGVLYPDEPYGKRMTEIFRQSALRHGGDVQTAAYAPANSASWPDAAGRLVGRSEINKTPFPTRNFHAVFLPDSWSSADQLITALRYNGEDRTLVFGSSLWGEGIQTRPPAVPQNYQLAVFPGAWNPAAQNAQALVAALGGTADFWHALGYDFVRFAAAMRIQQGWTPQLVNRRAAEAQRIDWTMAPLHWDAQGRAAQRLFLLTPVQGGFALVDPEQLKRDSADAQARFTERLRIAQGGSPPSQLLAPAGAPAAPLLPALPPPATQASPIER